VRSGRPEVGRGPVAALLLAALLLAPAGCEPEASGKGGTDDGDDSPGDDGAGDDGDGPDAAPTGGVLEDRECPDGSFLTYVNFGSAFFSENCTGCHSAELPPRMRQDAPEGVDFETLAKVRELAPLIYLRAADGYSLMPPVGGPSAEDRRLLGEWLACGAPD
jgi:hypothetical protein